AALTRAQAAADALARLARLRRLEIRQVQLFGHQASSTFTRCATFLSMPATAGLSRSCSAVLPIRPSPSARRVPRWRGDSPIALFTCVRRTLGTDGLLGLVRQDVDDRLAARLGDVLGAAQLAQRRLGGLEHVDRVRRPERLREHVTDPA